MESFAFVGQFLDRASRLRQDPEFIAGALDDPATRFVAFHGSKSLIVPDGPMRPAYLTKAEISQLGKPDVPAVFLGLGEKGKPIFVVDLSDTMASRFGEGELLELWRNAHRFTQRDGSILAYGKAMLEWHRNHRFCGRSGQANRIDRGGHQLTGANDHAQFPRVDPAIIVLVRRHERCLLGRQASWPKAHYSTLAGFVEPGEALEDAVRREVAEETDIKVGEVVYKGSQPWPFPSSLMVGFHATALSKDIVLNDGELSDARWFSRDELVAGHARLPPPASISFRLVEEWFDEGPQTVTLREVLEKNPSW